MKKIILSIFIFSISLNLLAAKPFNINEKVLHAFNRTFQNAKDVHWSEYLPYYEVNFKHNDIRTKITYNADGLIVKTIRYYSGEQLPLFILTKITNKYVDKDIFGVIEESTDNGVIYHVTLEDTKNWILISADDYGSLTVDNKYKKA
ncbi:MAG TPA: hypothetical protein VGO09_05795 [Flavisolibacter sp.]|nr:hypothetical protein [Flavisolibacter sp.]